MLIDSLKHRPLDCPLRTFGYLTVIGGLCLSLIQCGLSGSIAGAQEATRDVEKKRAVTIADTIEMSRVAGDPHYTSGPPIPLAYFSPDGAKFVVVLRKGNLESNTNDYSIVCFGTTESLRSARPQTLIRMSTSSNEDAIRQVRWIDDRMIAFLGHDGQRPTELYTFDLRTNHLRVRTHHRTGVLDYRMTGESEILFLADAPAAKRPNETREGREIILRDNRLEDILSGLQAPLAPEVFFLHPKRGEVLLPLKELPKEEGLPVENPSNVNRQVSRNSVAVSVEQDVNTPQRIYISNLRTNERHVLLDLNPQFGNLNFAHVELVDWKGSDGNEVENGGGLYLPPTFAVGKKYPLVIQTHYFQRDLFMIDGPWSSGYAAQVLAAKGFVVLQVHHAVDYYNHRSTEASAEMAMYEGAIDYLDQRGLIDRNRVGIFGFSRTVYHVVYTLTHSKYHFGAAVLEDGVDGGYLQYLSIPGVAKEYDSIYGGTPFATARAAWLRDAPGFNLDRVHTPIRIMEHGRAGALQQWEWFSGLRLLHKPVEMELLLDPGYGEHLLKIPRERLASLQGTVDWFCYWLKGEEDSVPEKADQYARWHQLKALEETTDGEK